MILLVSLSCHLLSLLPVDVLEISPNMADDLVFMMGEFEAVLPADRTYAENHLWLQPDGDDLRVGFTAYSVRLLQDVYFLDWTIDAQTDVAERQEIGEIESSKAVSSLFAPAAGRILEFNEALLDDPSTINTDNYGAGWLYRFQTDNEMLNPSVYLELLEKGWDDAQRMLKGQMN